MAAAAMDQSGETITSFVNEAVGNLPEDGPAVQGIRAKREIGFAVARHFNPAQEGDTAANRAALVTALEEHAGMSPAEADRAVAEWTASFERMQTDLSAARETAVTKTREAADSSADALAKFSLWAFVGFLIGALAATGGGHLGAKCASKCDERTDGQAYGSAHHS